MGLLVEGRWQDRWYDTDSTGGRFKRQQSSFRSWVTADASPGPTGDGGFKAEAGRYHLYVSYACPWAHRTLLFRKLKGLENAISVDVVHYHMGDEGWVFDASVDGATPDRVHGKKRLYEVYLEADASYAGRVTVPVLWDKAQGTIVNNESSEIIRMFNSAFDQIGAAEDDYFPHALRGAIDDVNATVYSRVKNGVYKAGFATSQEAYAEAFQALFAELDTLEERLSKQRYLVSERITEADWRLFTTLIRFDPVYVGHFKCNLRRIADYPNLSNYVRDLYQVAGVAETVHMDHIKGHYYTSHLTINPTGIVPDGPEIDYAAAHDRGRFGD
ncbi:MAG: glutathione S-transferase family protein [Hyphomicrobiales bacterium]|nr:glutathione S-transferase family protein [Hyphomicrobiales bacterium]